MPQPAGTTSSGPIVHPIQRHFSAREATMKLKIAALLAFGIPTLVLGPLMLGLLIEVVFLLWGRFLPWQWVFAGSFAFGLPLLFWTAARHTPAYFDDAIISMDPPQLAVAEVLGLSGLSAFAQNPEAAAIGFTEIALWGPWQTLDALGKIRGMLRLKSVDRARAAEILATLKNIDHMEVSERSRRDGDAGANLAALAYLIWYDWVGVSKDSQKVWLLSDSRKLLDPSSS